MFKAIEDKALSLYVSLLDKITELRENEAGQTSAEYIAVTAVAVLIAITVLYAGFQTSLDNAISSIGSNLNTWVSDQFSALGGS
jgi:Flp pilus assembly pilin Flp